MYSQLSILKLSILHAISERNYVNITPVYYLSIYVKVQSSKCQCFYLHFKLIILKGDRSRMKNIFCFIWVPEPKVSSALFFLVFPISIPCSPRLPLPLSWWHRTKAFVTPWMLHQGLNHSHNKNMTTVVKSPSMNLSVPPRRESTYLWQNVFH